MRKAHIPDLTVHPMSPSLCAHSARLDGPSRPLPPAPSALAKSAPYPPSPPTASRTRSSRSPSAPAKAPRLTDRPRRDGHALCVEPAQPTGDGHASERRARQSAVTFDSGQRHQLSLTAVGTLPPPALLCRPTGRAQHRWWRRRSTSTRSVAIRRSRSPQETHGHS